MSDKMQLAEALTSASKSLERSRQRVEELGRVLKGLSSPPEHVDLCNLASAQLAEMNRKIRALA